MLDYKILDYKYVIGQDNDTYVDLLSSSFANPTTFNGTPLIVNKYYVARPDLISFAVYGTDEYADILCKINGISNPFELNENDLIYIPDIDTILRCCNVATTPEEIVKPNDQLLYNKSKNNHQKNINEKRSDNEQVEGDKIYVIDKSLGIVFL